MPESSDRTIAFQVPDSDIRPLWDIWLSVFRLPALTVADELGVFSFLSDEPSTAEAVAEHIGSESIASNALLNLLAALGYLEKESGFFHLSAMARTYLLPSSPYYWGGVFCSVKDMPVSHAMIKEAILGGNGDARQAIVRKFTDEWKSGNINLENIRSFTAKMHSHAVTSANSLAKNPAFIGIRKLLDVGGGSGCYSTALASAYQDISCSIGELPAVCPITQEYVNASGYASRVDVLPFDMFNGVWPTNYDAVFFSDILHDWAPDQCLILASRAFDCLPHGGTIFIHEALLNDDEVGPLTVNAYSLAMLMVAQGKQYTKSELTKILSSVGFTDVEVTAAHGYYSLISARKP